MATASGYLMGSISSADIATKLAASDIGNVRRAGSGNPGAANAAAVLGLGWGSGVLVADMRKEQRPGAVGRVVVGPAGAYAAAAAAIDGHIAPVWSRGRGGKGGCNVSRRMPCRVSRLFPFDAAVAGFAAAAHRNAERTIWPSCSVWVAASVVWWWRRLPNAWGPPPTVGLPLFSARSSAMILTKFRSARLRP